MDKERLDNLLYRSVLRAIEGGGLRADKFIGEWFETFGNAYYFLFSKNLAVTNIQFAELASLLRVHTRSKVTDARSSRLLFLSMDELVEGLEDLVDSVSSTPAGAGGVARTLTDLYSPLITRMVVLEPLFGSCAVYLPPHLDLELAQICGYSGYIHSCGPLVYLCRSDKTTPEALLEGVRNHLDRTGHVRENRQIRFVLYGKEDFDGPAQASEVDLRHGLEDVQVFIDRFYVGDMRLVDFPRYLEKQLPRQVRYVSSWERGRANRLLARRKEIETGSTLFLLVEKNLGVDTQRGGEHRIYVCFEQLYINENPFHVFQENKPAWWSPTTMPHSLAGAMINLSRPLWPAPKTELAEPFAGSGTTAFEGLKFEGLSCHATDIEWITPLIAHDNLRFISFGSSKLEGLAKSLRDVRRFKEKLQGPGVLGENRFNDYSEARALLEEVIADQSWFELKFKEEFVEKLARCSLKVRLWFYVGLRAVIRHASAFLRSAKIWDEAYLKEAQILLGQMERLIEIRKREEKASIRIGRLSVYLGEYSTAVSIASDWLSTLVGDREEACMVCQGDATNLPEDAFDVVVTDPPYGFNTEENLVGLADLYRRVVEAVIGSLRDGGQFIVCLPERSYTGRRTRSFARARFFTEEVEARCEIMKREVRAVPQTGLEGWDLLRPPYYWEAEKTLRRSILHFRIRRRN